MLNLSRAEPRWLAIAGTALALTFAASAANAQGYDPYAGDSGYRSAPPETVEVYAPRHRQFPERSEIGAPIEYVSFSHEVRFDDLDLRTYWGARELRSRIRFVAQRLCDRMDHHYPIAATGSPPCYQTAYERAMDQADAAIAEARGYARE